MPKECSTQPQAMGSGLTVYFFVEDLHEVCHNFLIYMCMIASFYTAAIREGPTDDLFGVDRIVD
jgi:hypothetical protein